MDIKIYMLTWQVLALASAIFTILSSLILILVILVDRHEQQRDLQDYAIV